MRTRRYLTLNGRYGRWTLQSSVAAGVPYYRTDGTKRYRYHLVCLCDCGEYGLVRPDQLRSGMSESCGCLQRERASDVLSETALTHGLTTDADTRWLFYRACAQQARCTNPDHCSYHRYGGRGIEFRFNSVEDAVAYYQTLPNCDSSLEIDRIDNDGHYEVGNIRFVTRSDNLKNRTRRRGMTLRSN